MTLLVESMVWTCNRCGKDMTYNEVKLGMKWTNVEKPENIHLCYECGNEIIDFANGKEESHIKTFPAFKQMQKESEEWEAKHPPILKVKYPTMKQLIKDSKKKHPFYGNQHKKVVRK